MPTVRPSVRISPPASRRLRTDHVMTIITTQISQTESNNHLDAAVRVRSAEQRTRIAATEVIEHSSITLAALWGAIAIVATDAPFFGWTLVRPATGSMAPTCPTKRGRTSVVAAIGSDRTRTHYDNNGPASTLTTAAAGSLAEHAQGQKITGQAAGTPLDSHLAGVFCATVHLRTPGGTARPTEPRTGLALPMGASPSLSAS